eukprot:scaffold14780_cov72-Phaeocystis_antarctica.AAC.2
MGSLNQSCAFVPRLCFAHLNAVTGCNITGSRVFGFRFEATSQLQRAVKPEQRTDFESREWEGKSAPVHR